MVVLLLASALGATPVADVPDPRPRGAWVSDVAGVIPDAQERALDAALDALHAELGVEIGVVTVDEVDGTPKQFTTALFDAWGLGDARANNGLLVVLVMGQRSLEMETGYGLEGLLPDGWLGAMQQDAMVPLLRAGDPGGALLAGVERIGARLRLDPEAARVGTDGAVRVPGPPPRPASATDPTVRYVILGLGLAALLGLAWLGWERRQRRCPTCRIPMPLLDEVADDAHLDAGQRAEERLGSVDWEVRVCDGCGFVRIRPRTAWFSGYGRCPACRVRAATSTTTTVRAATTSHGGLVRVDVACAHCGHRSSRTRSTPRRAPPSSRRGGGRSGGSGGGRSWGGGRSGGGGAGSRW